MIPKYQALENKAVLDSDWRCCLFIPAPKLFWLSCCDCKSPFSWNPAKQRANCEWVKPSDLQNRLTGTVILIWDFLVSGAIKTTQISTGRKMTCAALNVELNVYMNYEKRGETSCIVILFNLKNIISRMTLPISRIPYFKNRLWLPLSKEFRHNCPANTYSSCIKSINAFARYWN